MTTHLKASMTPRLRMGHGAASLLRGNNGRTVGIGA
jgi:hypothetical protein